MVKKKRLHKYPIILCSVCANVRSNARFIQDNNLFSFYPFKKIILLLFSTIFLKLFFILVESMSLKKNEETLKAFPT